MTPDLYPYQEAGYKWLCTPKPNAGRHNLNAMLNDSPGLGKTVQAIYGADQLNAKNILVLCKGIGRRNWKREFEFWQQKPRSVGIISGFSNPELADVTIVAYPTLQSRAVLTALLKREWDIIIPDEAQALKNPRSLTTRIVYGQRCDGKAGLVSRSAIVWPLTGTAWSNGLHEFWTHCHALWPSACRNLEDYDDWYDRFVYWRMGDFGKQALNAQNVAEFVERIYPYMLRRTEAELPDLPPLRWGHVVVEPSKVPQLPPELVEAQTVLAAAIAELRAGNPTPQQIQATLAVQSMHIASLIRWTGLAKVHAVAESVNAELNSGVEKMVLFARHRDVFKVLEQEIPNSVSITGATPEKTRDYYIDVFQGRATGLNIRCLNCSMEIASTTLTLTAAHHVGIVESGWVPDPISQAAKRCARIGQKFPVLARLYSLAGSIDEETNEVVMRKYLMAKQVDQHIERLSA